MSVPAVTTSNIRQNYLLIKERIAMAARSAGRNEQDICLVVVTKTHPPEIIQAVVNAGATDLGENYVEEAIPKIVSLSSNKDITWHMIGHVQSRKAPLVCDYFQYLHSLDSVKLAERLSKFASEKNKLLPVFLEFNIAGEATKSGWDIYSEDNWRNILPDVEKIVALPGIEILGLMTIPPYSTEPEASRSYYRKLRQFQEYLIRRLELKNFNGLSIGMSGDYEVAIQEGSTCLRIGQAILGPRKT